MKKTAIILALAGWILGMGTSSAELGAGAKGSPSAPGLVKKGKDALKEGRLEEAFAYFLKGAKKEDPEAENMAGKCYEQGLGVAICQAEAATWFLKAALQGHADGANNVGNCYMHGIGVRRDDAEAFKYYHQAATRGSAAGAYNLAYCYESGYGVPKNMSAARHFYSLAAKKGYAMAQSRMRQLDR